MPFARYFATRSALWQSLLISLVALSLTACADKSMPPLRVTLPPLPAQAVQPCALPSPLPDGNVSTLITALLDSWEAQSQCEVKRRAVVDAYEAARAVNGE